jgi:hypothetical protein
VARWEETRWAGSTVLSQLVRSGRKPDETVILRATAEKRVANSALERRDAADRARGGVVTEEVTWSCTLEILRPSTGEILGEFAGQVAIDPFANTGEEEFDPDAPMTHLLERMAGEALTWAAKALPESAPDRDPPPLRLAMSPAFTAAQRDVGLQTMDALAAEVWLQNRARFLTPSLDERQLTSVSQLPPSLWVLDAQDGASLLPGDVILEVDDGPPLPQVLYRKHLAGGVAVTVRRGTAELEVMTP